MRLTDNKILITGGTSGIGLEMVSRFYKLGNKLVVVGRDQRNLKEVQRQHPRVDIYQCDLGQKGELNGFLQYLQLNHSDINLIINNAGIQNNFSVIVPNMPTSEIDYEVQVNLVTPMKIITSSLPWLVQTENACIVNVTSVLGIVPKHSAPIYCASKAGLHNFTQTLRYQLRDAGIHVFELNPPLVDTKMTHGQDGNKLSPQQLVDQFLNALEKDKTELNAGKAKLVRWAHRLLPKQIEKIMLKN